MQPPLIEVSGVSSLPPPAMGRPLSLPLLPLQDQVWRVQQFQWQLNPYWLQQLHQFCKNTCERDGRLTGMSGL